jgi:hypothetical protein
MHEAVLADVKGRVRISLDKEGTAWVGEQIQVNLDLMTTGYRFSESQFNLPEVAGAFIMQTDSTTIKLSESMNEETWQVVRYPLSVFPQKDGTIQIPPIKVRFSSASAFGSIPRQFDLQTTTLMFFTKLPPGANANHMVVTTRDFDLKYKWSPALKHFEIRQEADDSSAADGVSQYAAKPGDAITLNVTRHAQAISGMLLTPIPVFEAEGLSVYPKAAEVEDKVNRGSLIGVRSDEFTWVVEKAGEYTWPDIEFQWWDPSSEQLKSKTVTGFTLHVTAQQPAAGEVGLVSEPGNHQPIKLAMIVLALIMVLGLLWKWKSELLRQKIDEYQARKSNSEKSSFERFQMACKQGKAPVAYATFNDWLTKLNGAGTSVAAFSARAASDQIQTLYDQLQLAVANRDQAWDGNEFSRSIAHERRRRLKKNQKPGVTDLPKLNPTEGPFQR